MPNINPENKLTQNLDSPDATQPEQLPPPDQTEDEGTNVRALPPRFMPTKQEWPAPEVSQVDRPIEPPEAKKETPIMPESVEKVSALKRDFVDSLRAVAIRLPEIQGDEKADSKLKEEIDSHYSKMQKDFFRLTGESLDRKVKSVAYAEVREAGGKVISREKFFSKENVAEEEKKETKRRIGAGVRVSWNILPEEEKKKRIDESGDIKIASKKYAKELELKRQELKKKGIDFPVDVYYDILAQGAEPQKTKKKLFGDIVVSCAKERDEKISPKVFFLGGKKDFKNLMDKGKYDIMMAIRESARVRMKGMYENGKSDWMHRKINTLEAIAGGIISAEETRTPIRPVDNFDFETMKIDAEYENSLDLLSDKDLVDMKEREENEFKGRVKKFESIIDTDCGPICLKLGLTQEQAGKFIQAAKKGKNLTGIDKKLESLLGRILDKRGSIHRIYQNSIEPIGKVIASRDQIKMEKALAEIREKLEAA